MPATYRIELAKTARSSCKNTDCKNKNDMKIEKGQLRFGSLVEIKEHQSWMWKHWGCVTPVQIQTWNEVTDGDEDLIDGFEELDDDSKDKVRRALKQGHVDDSDWRGDIEKNRPGQKGFRLTKAELKKLGRDVNGNDAGDDDDSDTKPKPKKRGRPAKKATSDHDDTEDEAEPTVKKSRTDVTKSEHESANDPEEVQVSEDDAAAKTGEPAQKSSAEAAGDAKTDKQQPNPLKRPRGRPRKSDGAQAPAGKTSAKPPKKQVEAGDDQQDGEPPKKKPGRPKKVPVPDAGPPQPKRKPGRPKKVVAA